MWRSIPLVVLVAACTAPAVDVALRLPTGDVDLSCVEAVRFRAFGEGDTEPLEQCIALDGPIAGFGELTAAIHGKLALAIPPTGLAGLDLGGMTLPDCGGEAVFYGGADYTGDDLTVPVTAALDCAARTQIQIRPVDYDGLIAGTCDAPARDLVPGGIHPTMLSEPLPIMLPDMSPVPVSTGAGGAATIPEARLPIDDASCFAIGDTMRGSLGCVAPGAPGVCTTGAQVELTSIDVELAAQSIDGITAARHAQIVFGSVWTATGTKHPIAGAQIAIAPADADQAELRYLHPGGAALVELAGATATDASGLFVAYTNRPITVTVSAPGYHSRQVRLAGADFLFGATTVVLTPQ